MNNKPEQISFRIPTKPKVFLFEESNILMTFEKIQKFSKDFNFTYILDYVNATVTFQRKQNANS